MNKVKLRNAKGITLVALIATVVVLSVLAGVTINGISGTNGIYTETQSVANNQSSNSNSISAKVEQILTNKASTDNQLPASSVSQGEIGDYSVVFKNYNGTVLQELTLAYGSNVEYTGSTPAKPSTAQKNYVFSGWDKVVTPVIGNEIYTAQFSEVARQYAITFVDGDGNTVQTTTLAYGETPVYRGVTPTKSSTAQYDYVFNNIWSPSIVTVTGEQTYTAQFISNTRQYTIAFVDGDGNTIQTSNVAYGAIPVYTGSTPTKASTPDATYVFNNTWTPAITAVTGDATYTAGFLASAGEYTITWDVNGTRIQQNYEYGETPVFTGDTNKPSTVEIEYTFSGWSPNIEAVTGNVTYVAQYNEGARKYTVNFNNYDGSVITTQQYRYEEGIVIPDNPTRASDSQYVYVFKSWSPSVNEQCMGDKTYTATYDSYTRYFTVSYNNMGATGTIANQQKERDISLTLSDGAGFTKEGYELIGWDTSSTATTAEYALGETYNNNESTTLYAVWNRILVVAKNSSYMFVKGKDLSTQELFTVYGNNQLAEYKINSVDIANISTLNEGTYTLQCSYNGYVDETEITIIEKALYNYEYNAEQQPYTFTAPADGIYEIQCWGAQGGNCSSGIQGGNGGYTEGKIELSAGDNFNIYVGQQGNANSSTIGGAETFNGGGKGGNGYSYPGGASGGGATDIREPKQNTTEKYRYVRDYINGSNKNTAKHWVEVKVYDINNNLISNGKPISTSISTTTNIARVTDGVITSSSYYGVDVSGVQWVEIDLGAEYEIGQVIVYHYYSDGRIYYNTKTELYSEDRVMIRTLYNSATSGTYTETSSGHILNGTDGFVSDLSTRIMVAGAGGGAGTHSTAGYGGGVIGGEATIYNGNTVLPGTQITGYALGFGQAGRNAISASYGAEGNGGGGAGYYGGEAYQIQGVNTDASGAGGSSYISGLSGCTEYTGYVFTDAVTKSGNDTTMPTWDGTGTMTGNTGNGYAKITYLGVSGTEMLEKDIDFTLSYNELSNGNYEISVQNIVYDGNISDLHYEYEKVGTNEWQPANSSTFTVPESGAYNVKIYDDSYNYKTKFILTTEIDNHYNFSIYRNDIGISPTIVADAALLKPLYTGKMSSAKMAASIASYIPYDYVLIRAKAYIYCQNSYSLTTTINTDDAGSVYLNDNLVVTRSTNGSSSMTLNFIPGWNILDVYVKEGTGDANLYFGTNLATNSNIYALTSIEPKELAQPVVPNQNDKHWNVELFLRPSTISGNGTVDATAFANLRPMYTMKIGDPMIKSGGIIRALAPYNYILIKGTTYIYCDNAFTLSTTILSDDGGSVYLNGVKKVAQGSVASTNVSLNFQSGWNVLEVYVNEGDGDAEFYFGTILSTNANIKYLTSERPAELEPIIEDLDDSCWNVELYARPSTVSGTSNVTRNHFEGLKPMQSMRINDTSMTLINNAIPYNYVLIKGTTYVYCNNACTISTTLYTDDGGTGYLNGTVFGSNASCTTSNVTLNFNQGWNVIEVYVNENDGGAGFYLGTNLSTNANISILRSTAP